MIERSRPLLFQASEVAAQMLGVLGGGRSPIDPGANGYEFVRRYNLRIDGSPLVGPAGLDGDYKHLRDLYEDPSPKQVAMAGAQTGKSAWLMTHLARTCYAEAFGKMVGYYFPDKHLPAAFSHSRFKPFIRSNDALKGTLGRAAEVGERGKDATLTLSLAGTLLYFMTIGGKTATEGLPLPAVYFDEVRRMAVGDIERAMERYSAQRNPIDVKVSTARYPESDIHLYFLEGDQRYFHTGCNCAEGVVLSMTFPDCVADLRAATPALKRKVAHAFEHAGLPYLGMTEAEHAQYPPAAYICPSCGEILVDPREGYWEPHAGNRFIHSWQMPQLLSPTYPAGRVLQKFEKSKDRQEFENSCRGLPFVDRTKMRLTSEQVDACVDKDLEWGEHLSADVRRRRLTNCAMGVDVQAGYGICVISARSDRGKHRVVHLEVVRNPAEDRSWWHRLGVLMGRYDVKVCVVDEAPEFNDSLAFAHAFRGRVWLANFALGETSPRFVAWDEASLDGDTKQRGEAEDRYRVSLQRTKALDWLLKLYRSRQVEIPNLQTLTQRIPVDSKGKPVFSAHLRAGVESAAALGLVLRDDLSRFVFRDLLEDEVRSNGGRRVVPERIGKVRQVAEWFGAHSPDFAFAALYCAVAQDRIGTPTGVGRLG